MSRSTFLRSAPYVEIHGHRVDLFLAREFPVLSWPAGQSMKWERFSFPIRCLDQVQALAEECSQTTHRAARELVKARRREILWTQSSASDRYLFIASVLAFLAGVILYWIGL